MSVLDHEHVLAMIAVCSEMRKPILALYPAPECGDLCSFLSRLSNTPRYVSSHFLLLFLHFSSYIQSFANPLVHMNVLTLLHFCGSHPNVLPISADLAPVSSDDVFANRSDSHNYMMGNECVHNLLQFESIMLHGEL